MDTIKTFKRKDIELKVSSFDQDKEIEICISRDSEGSLCSTWLTPNEVNELITHLCNCLKFIKEPIEMLDAE